MKPKGTPTRRRRPERTQVRRERSAEREVSRDLREEVERPLDAEDVALASLEAQVRAQETQANLGSAEPDAGVSVRLPRAVMTRLQAEAAKRHITLSELITRALMQYLGI